MSDNEDNMSSDASNSSDEDWEEVKHKSEASSSDDDIGKEPDIEEDLVDYQPSVTKDGIVVQIETGGSSRNKKSKDWKARKEAYQRLKENRKRKLIQLNLHKASFLIAISRGFYLNSLALADDEINCISFSLLPMIFRMKKVKKESQFVDIEAKVINQQFVKLIVKSFRDHFTLDTEMDMDIEDTKFGILSGHKVDEKTSLVNFFDQKVTSNVSTFALGFISILRSIKRINSKLQVRLVYAIKPISHKAELILSDKQKSRSKSSTQSSSKSSSSGYMSKSSSPDIDADEVPPKRSRRSKAASSSSSRAAKSKSKSKGSKKMEVLSENSEDDDVVVLQSPPKGSKRKLKKNQELIEFWAEIYLTSENKWVPIDVVNNLINDPLKFNEYLINDDFNYVISFDDCNHLKDVTSRYTNKLLLPAFKRCRVDENWIIESLIYFKPNYETSQEKEEDLQLKLNQECQPLPTTLSEFKNHPLYLLQKHLLVNEVIRNSKDVSADAIPVGSFRGEPVYSRQDVFPCKSKEFWMRSAKVVKETEDPIKVVKGRKKWDKYSERYIENIPKNLYAEWQTQPFVPETAVDGKVPKNSFGNVELFQPEMIPFGCVHLRMQGVGKVAAKLGIDCAQAVVGFDNAKHGVHPVFDGYVVCSEYKNVLIDAINEERSEKVKKDKEKKQKRVLNNWKKLTKSLLIRERLRKKYEDCN